MKLVRSLFAIGLCPALLLALQQAPLLHFHAEGRATEHVISQHGHGLGAHSHLSRHSEQAQSNDGSGMEAVDESESAVSISFFHSNPAKTLVQHAIRPALPVVDMVAQSAARVLPERPRIHDPPQQFSLGPRAPPA
jgi:hypothetical protein